MTRVFSTVLRLILIAFLTDRVWGQGSCVKDADQVLEDDPSRSCRKSCTLDSECTGLKSCECDNDCGFSCFNPNAICEEVLSITDGTIRYHYPTGASGTDNIYATEATHKCDTGYHLLGQETRNCRSDRTWSHTHNLPNCTRVCVDPGRIADGISSNSGPFFVGDKMIIQCVAGYYAEAGSVLERTCQSDYTWSPVNYVCTIRNCGPPDDVMDATYANRDGTTGDAAFNFGATIDYTCDTGYTLSGTSAFFCMIRDDGNVAWKEDSAAWPTCSAVECPMPTAPENGGHDSLSISQFQYGYQVTYNCNAGYDLVGNEKGTCNEDGEWGNVPTCEGSIDATFDNSDNDGYTVISGTFARTLKEQANGLSGYVMAGSGTIRSVPISLSSGERICVKTEYSMADEDELEAQGFSNNREKDLATFPQSQAWTTTYFWLELVDKAADTEVELQFVATGEVYINKIAQDADASCASAPEPGTTTTTTTLTAAAVTTATTTTTASSSGECQKNEAQALSDDPSRTCLTPCSLDTDCTVESESCECDDDCGYSCFNPNAICAEVLSVTDGTIGYKYPTGSSGTDKIYATEATYTCNAGYRLLGEGTRKCRSDRTWSHTHNLPNCTISHTKPDVVSTTAPRLPVQTTPTQGGSDDEDDVEEEEPEGLSPGAIAGIAIASAAVIIAAAALACVRLVQSPSKKYTGPNGVSPKVNGKPSPGAEGEKPPPNPTTTV